MRVKDFTKILVVDDEPEVVDIISTELKSIGGVLITEAQDAMDAYRKARNQHFDLICSDFRMAKLNGAKLLMALREQRFNANTPVIVISGFPEEAKKECLAAGINHFVEYMGKPFQSSELISAAKRMLALEKTSHTFKFDDSFIAPFVQATAQTLKMMGEVTGVVVQSTAPCKAEEILLADISVSISLSSPQFRGGLTISFPKDTFLRICNHILGDIFVELAPEVQDVAAELASIIHAAARNSLIPLGHELEQATPSVITGTGHRVSHGSLTRSASMLVRFKSDLGPFFMIVSIE